jgi:uncharacterized protein DUF4382
MKSLIFRLGIGVSLAAMMLFATGCGSSGSSSASPSPTPQAQNGTVNVLVSDDPTEDWAAIGVRVLSVSLTPQGGGNDVTIYTAPNPAPYINLLQLDQLSEIIGNASVRTGTYSAATITVSGNPGDVILTASADPELGFAAAPGATIPSSQIQIMDTKGSAGSLTVPVKLTLDSPLVVTANQSNALDLEFNLAHPAFIVAHVPPANPATAMWAINFKPCLRHRQIFDLTRVLLRHHYGTVTGATDTTLTFNKDYPVYPPTNPETAISTTQSLSVQADSVNGTLYYDVDAKAPAVALTNFSTITSSIMNKYIRVAARYQVDGTLVAVRVWASSNFNSVWISPEGHVLHVNTATNTLVVDSELGIGVPLTVDANTLYYFRTPANAQTDANSIGQGTAFLANLVRGFKVHCSVVDPLASPLVASSIDIEIARFDGTISGATLNNFTTTHAFRTVSDDYNVLLDYVPSNTANGNDPQTGNPIQGFEWWNFTFPIIVDSGSGATGDFENATNGAVNFSGTVGLMKAAGLSSTIWDTSSGSGDWAAKWTVLTPTKVPLGTAATGYSSGSFTIGVPGGTNFVTVHLNTSSGSGTLVYQVDWTNDIITISPVDVTTTAGQTTLSTNLVANTPVKAFGIPQADGSIKCYVLFYFTGFAEATTN